VNSDNEEYEIGRGTISALGVLTRSVVFQSSNANALVVFTSGLKHVINGIPQEFFTTVPTANYVPKADSGGKIDSAWLRNSLSRDYLRVTTFATTLDIDLENGSKQLVTLTNNVTLTLSNLRADGNILTLALKQGGSGSYTVTWFDDIIWPGGAPVQPSTAVGSITYYDFFLMTSGDIHYRPYGSSGGGGGGVDGPLATNVDAVAVWDITDGTLLRNSLVNIHAGANDKLEFLASFGAVIEVPDGGSMVFDLDQGNNFYTSLSTTRTFTVANASVGQVVNVFVENVNPLTVTWWDNILWSGKQGPTFGYTTDAWTLVTLLCYGVDSYSNPLFVELGRRGSALFDNQNKTFQNGVSGTIAEITKQVYTLSGNVTIPAPTGQEYGLEVTFINVNSTTVTLTAASSSLLSNQASQESPLVLDGQYQAVTLLGTPSGWILVNDTRQPQMSISTFTSTSTVPRNINYVRVADGIGAINLTLNNGYRGKILFVKKIGTGTVTVKNISASTLYIMSIDEEFAVFIYNSGWEIVLTGTAGTTTSGNGVRTLKASGLAATGDQITCDNTTKVFSSSYVLSAGAMSVGKRLKIKLGGTWNSSAGSGILYEIGVKFDDGTNLVLANWGGALLSYNISETGNFLVEGEIICSSTVNPVLGVFQIAGSQDLAKANTSPVRAVKSTSMAFNHSIANTIRPYAYANTAVVVDLRVFSIEGD